MSVTREHDRGLFTSRREFAAVLRYGEATTLWIGDPPPAARGPLDGRKDSAAELLRACGESFAIVASDGRKAWAATDRFNVRRLYYSISGGEMRVASTVLGLRSIGCPLALDPDRVVEYLALGFVPGTGTLFRGVHRVPAGSVLSVRDLLQPTAVIERYFDPVRDTRPHGMGWDDLVQEYGSVLEDAISKQLDAAGVNAVLLLSGGLDSRAILAAGLARERLSRVRIVTYGTPELEDVRFALAVGQRLGLRLEFYRLDDNRLSVSDLAAGVSLNDGGSEVFCQCPFPLVQSIDDRVGGGEVLSGFIGDPLAGSLLDPQLEGRPPEPQLLFDYVRKKKLFLQPEEVARFTGRSVSDVQELLMRTLAIGGEFHDLAEAYESWMFKERIGRYNTENVLVGPLLYRTPFTDPSVVALALGAARPYRRGKAFYREVLRRRYPAAFACATTDDGLPLSGRLTLPRLRKLGRRIWRRADRGWKELRGRDPMNPFAKYRDWSRAFRADETLGRMATTEAEKLVAAGILTDQYRRAVQEHLSRGADRSTAIRLGTSLSFARQSFCE